MTSWQGHSERIYCTAGILHWKSWLKPCQCSDQDKNTELLYTGTHLNYCWWANLLFLFFFYFSCARNCQPYLRLALSWLESTVRVCSIGDVYYKQRYLAFESSKCDPGDLLMSDESVLRFRVVISLLCRTEKEIRYGIKIHTGESCFKNSNCTARLRLSLK
jgi:hypothetical protein